jgi:hypothetical protein
MSMSVLVEKKIVSYNNSTVTFPYPNLSNSICGQKYSANFAQIGQILFELVGFSLLISKFQLKNCAC